ncbi:alpha,alpha-trehalase [[Emmonsia] crescens]|uniref:Trehalase n=1 Tax=[Emmonsia] crescens TaxID=73230 RepID=A0A0G2J4Q9_9EURO|nr:alpha,alpha-trehalase [Emmonsia crescens UAMH 3008]
MKESSTPLIVPLTERGVSHVVHELRKSSSIPAISKQVLVPRTRRGSHGNFPLSPYYLCPATFLTGNTDEGSLPPVFKVWVDDAMKSLLAQEDTDNNLQITILDNGPKVVSLGTLLSDGGRTREIRGTYLLANLLEELHLTKGKHASKLIHFSDVSENPVARINRKIKDQYWNNLTRRLDESMIETAAPDPKDWNEDPRPRIFVPFGEEKLYEYYCQVSRNKPELKLEVQYLPQGEVTAEYVHGLRDRPGLLALEMDYSNPDKLRGLQFIVPGGRFNECYYWDSYFACLGLLEVGRIDLVRDILNNFIFQVKHYGKIPNANRSYYLCRSQPPFLSDLAVRTFKGIDNKEEATEVLRAGILAAIREYFTVWMSEPRYDPATGLSRFKPPGKGIPLEVEEGHFDAVLYKYAEKYACTIPEFIKQYNSGNLNEPQLDEFFMHDRGVRESGHDTSYRFDQGCADLATVDLNCLLYKYENDIAWAIKTVFNDKLPIPAEWRMPDMKDGHVESSASWLQRANQRQERANKYLWDPEQGMYFDYNTRTGKRTTYEYVTTLYPLWCGIASREQAESLVTRALPKFECVGGLSTSTEKSRGPVSMPHRPPKQWDFPFGWAPHQVLAWDGLKRYGYTHEMERLVYRWLQLMVRVAVNYHGAIVEKYDVTQLDNPSQVDAEYGNQGLDFKYANIEGFGWSNASFSYGLSLIKHQKLMVKALGLCVPYDDLRMEGAHR